MNVHHLCSELSNYPAQPERNTEIEAAAEEIHTERGNAQRSRLIREVGVPLRNESHRAILLQASKYLEDVGRPTSGVAVCDYF